jgi:hypothetical protein
VFRILGGRERRYRQKRAAEKMADLAIIVISERCMTRLRRVISSAVHTGDIMNGTLMNVAVMIRYTMITRVIFAVVIITVVTVSRAMAING